MPRDKPAAVVYLETADQLSQLVPAAAHQQLLVAGVVVAAARPPAVRTHVAVHVVSLGLAHSHTRPVEPVLAAVTADVEPVAVDTGQWVLVSGC